MKIYKFLLLLIISTMLLSCSSDDENPAGPTASPLNGTWNIYQSLTGGGEDYVIDFSSDLKFEGATVSGTGKLEYSYLVNNSTLKLTVQGSVVGAYNDPNINIAIADGTTGNVFNFIGSWDETNVNFRGTSKITIDDSVRTYEGLSLFKGN